MTDFVKKFLANQSLELSRQVTHERLKRAGVSIGNDMGLKKPQSGAAATARRLPPKLVKRLAGK